MALSFPGIDVTGIVRGNIFNYRSAVVAASANNGNWTGTASASYVNPTLTITGLTAGTTFGALDSYTTLVANDRILLKNMSTISAGTANNNSYNGIWFITGGTTTSITCVRAPDLIDGDSVKNITLWINNGTLHGNSAWTVTESVLVSTGTPANAFTFTQYDVMGTLAVARGGTGVASFGGTNTLLYTTTANVLASLATANNGVLVTNGTGVPSISSTLPTAVVNNISHAQLSGLLADDHTQYALLAGRAGGQTLIGGTAAGNNLTLQSTSNASRGAILHNDPVRVDVIDALTATTLTIGNSVATKVQLGKTTTTVEIMGDLFVRGVTTQVDSENLNIADNNIYLNAGYTTAAAQTGGLVVNYLPIATTDTVATGGFATTTTVITTGSATFAVGQFIQISGANTIDNNGIFEVLSHVGTTLTIRSSPVETFSQNVFVVDTTVAGSITRLNVTVMRAGTDGIWETGRGAVTPITYTDLSTTVRWSYSVLTNLANANGTTYTTIGYFPFQVSTYNPGSITTGVLIAWVVVGANRNLDIQVFDGTSQIGIISVTAGTAAGVFTGAVTTPTTNVLLEFRIRKSAAGGTNPQVFGLSYNLTM